MNGFKVRLGDGSEIGPMDLAALRTWLSQGLVDQDSPVMRPGTRKWVPLASVPELKGLAGPSRRSGRTAGKSATPRTVPAARGSRGEDLDRPEPDRLDRWRTAGVGILLLALGALLAVPVFLPTVALPALDAAPWLQLALGFFALGLALLPGWELARKLVRALLCLAAFALFPVAGILLAQGERGAALLVVGSAWLLVSGLLVLLAPSLAWGRLLVALVPVLLGLAGVVRFARAADSEEARQLREWSSPERRFTDEALGLTLDVPRGWVVLKPGNPIAPAPSDARLLLAQPRLGGLAWLLTGPAPQGVASAEQYLERVIARRRSERPGYQPGPQANALVGTLAGRRAAASWLDDGVRQSELIVAGVDGWMGFALVAWMPEAGAGRAADGLEPLVGALVARGLFAGRMREAVDKALAAVPHLTPAAAAQLMAGSEARVLEPEQAFRRSVVALSKLIPALSQAESRELAGLSTAAYQGVPWAARGRLSGYIERVRRGDTTSADEDREMAGLMKAAEVRLSPARLLRLRAYYDKAVLAGS
jgi:hypothetical protein